MKGILLIGIAMILLIGIASALEFDNVKDFAKTKDQVYGTITITNAFGLGGKIAEITLDKNTDACSIDCSADGTTILEKKAALFSGIKFKIVGTETYRELSYKIYVDGKEYNGEELEPGTYTWRIEGKKGVYESIDWIATSNGIDLTEWALWTSKVLAYWDFDEGAGTTANDRLNTFDLTVTATNWKVGGKINGGYEPQKDSIDTGINMSKNLNLSAVGGGFTLNFWLNRTTLITGSSVIFANKQSTDTTAGFFEINKDDAPQKLYINVFDGTAPDLLLNGMVLTENVSYMISLVINATNATIFVNGTSLGSVVKDAFEFAGTDLWLGAETDGGGKADNMTIDEVGIWNRTLTPSEITLLYNSGAGQSYGAGEVSLNSPADFSKYFTNQNITFNCTAAILNSKNTTLFIDNKFNFSTTEQAINRTYAFSLGFPAHNWTCEVYDTAHTKFTTSLYHFNASYYVENSQSYNSSVYETSSADFYINYSYDNSLYTAISASLNYNGTSYAGTKTGAGSNIIFSRIGLGVPTVNYIDTKNFNWILSLTNVTGTFLVNSTAYTQTVSPINLTICNYAGTPSITYINFTFKDETNSTYINATIDTSTWTYYLGDGTNTKTYIFSNLTASVNVPFCFQPADKTLHKTVNLQFSAVGYPQRRWEDDSDLTNTSTNKVLYLLSSSEGIYSVYQVINSAGSPISGVTVQVERQFSGLWTLVEQGITDSAGTVTFWLNPNYDHRITFTKTGYSSNQVTIRPSSSTYTISLSSSGGAASFNSSTEGMKWIISPSPGLVKGTVKFGFNLTARLCNVVSCRLRLLDNLSVELASVTGCSACGGNISVNFNTETASKIYGEFSIDAGSGYFIVDADAYWIRSINYTTTGTIKSAMERILTLREWGLEDQRAEYSRIVFFFLVLTIGLGVLSFSTGWDFATSGGILIFMCFIIWMVSLTGFLNLSHLTPYTELDRHFLALMTTFITVGYMLNKLRRESSG